MRLKALLGLLCASGCVAYNDVCQPLVVNPDERVAFVAKDNEIFLDRFNVRHANNALGQQVADAFVWVFSETDRPADFGVLNSGSIREEGLCVSRTVLPEGPITKGVLHEILLFENPVQALDLSEAEVVSLFEHSVEQLIAAPGPIVSPSGAFLQVSKAVSLTVDCSRPAMNRVTALSISGSEVQIPGRPFLQRRFRVATTQFLFAGGDGYSMLVGKSLEPTRNAANAQKAAGIDSNITAAYLNEAGFNLSVEKGIPSAGERIKFVNCSIPQRP